MHAWFCLGICLQIFKYIFWIVITTKHFYPGLPGWAGTRRNIQISWSSTIFYQLPPSTMIHSILPILCTISLQVLLSLPLALEPSIPYSIHPSSLCSVCPYHHNLFCCSTEIMLPIPTLFLNCTWNSVFKNFNVTHPSDHSHRCNLIFFSYSLQAVSHFRILLFTHNCCTVCLS